MEDVPDEALSLSRFNTPAPLFSDHPNPFVTDQVISEQKMKLQQEMQNIADARQDFDSRLLNFNRYIWNRSK